MGGSMNSGIVADRLFRAQIDHDGSSATGVVASFLIHAVFFLSILMLLPFPAALNPLVPDAVRVTVVSALPAPLPQPTNAVDPGVAPLRPAVPVSIDPERFQPRTQDLPLRKAAPEENEMIRATQIFAGAVLATPEARQARLTLPTLIDEDRKLQLCGLEAMEQIHVWDEAFEPVRLVAYAMADARISGPSVVADGAAFRSRGRWFNLRFRCEVTPDMRDVVAFEFAVGEPVPYEDWLSHNLAAVH